MRTVEQIQSEMDELCAKARNLQQELAIAKAGAKPGDVFEAVNYNGQHMRFLVERVRDTQLVGTLTTKNHVVILADGLVSWEKVTGAD